VAHVGFEQLRKVHAAICMAPRRRGFRQSALVADDPLRNARQHRQTLLRMPFQNAQPGMISFERHCFTCTYAAAPPTPLAACSGLTFLPSLLYRTLGGGARLRRPSRERTLLAVSSVSQAKSPPDDPRRTERSCREWRTKRSTAASSTSWARRTRRRRRHLRYHLHSISVSHMSGRIPPTRIFFLWCFFSSETYEWQQTRPCCGW